MSVWRLVGFVWIGSAVVFLLLVWWDLHPRTPPTPPRRWVGGPMDGEEFHGPIRFGPGPAFWGHACLKWEATDGEVVTYEYRFPANGPGVHWYGAERLDRVD